MIRISETVRQWGSAQSTAPIFFYRRFLSRLLLERFLLYNILVKGVIQQVAV
jgi:hypothetical protein